MRLAAVTGKMLRDAVAIYLEEAFGDARPRRKIPDLSGVGKVEDSLHLLADEARRHGQGHRARRWVLRLGNSRYPNMKLVLEEYLLEGEFVFTVDTHDAADVLPLDPDAPAWAELRQWNLALKRRIEARWRKGGLPTYAALRDLLARPARKRRGKPRATVLVVDDEPDIADTVAAVLAGEGYRVQRAFDGPEALDALESARPDLILMDYEMPRMKGTEVCARIRRSREHRDIPILMATAAMVDLAAMADADGFLVKPYQRDVLLSFVNHLTSRGKGKGKGKGTGKGTGKGKGGPKAPKAPKARKDGKEGKAGGRASIRRPPGRAPVRSPDRVPPGRDPGAAGPVSGPASGEE